jgi:hypothetical protein
MPPEQANLVIDLTLPPSGHVSGVVRRSDGSPVANATVYLRSSGYDFDRVVYADENGAYTARHVALGYIAASAQDPGHLDRGLRRRRAHGARPVHRHRPHHARYWFDRRPAPEA